MRNSSLVEAFAPSAYAPSAFTLSSMAKPRKISVRRSPIHGRGVFALRPIRRGSIVVEYKGERLDNEEIDARYGAEKDTGHTMLFAVDDETTIDPNRRGNIARFINHSCAGNCRAVEMEGRIYIEAVKPIRPGTELTYDYKIEMPKRTAKAIRALFACRCGAPRCRGTMLAR